MKKFIAAALTVALALCLLSGCGKAAGEKVLKVGASVTPHAQILAVAKEILAKQGITLEIVEYTDYVQPNLAVENGDLDANYFQHKPYMDDFNAGHSTHLAAVAAIHYEPFGVYAGKTKAIAELKDGAKIGVPNDGSNEARALYLLESQGLIKMKKDAGFTATVLDIESNPHGYDIIEMEAAQLTLALPDLELAVINGNYALQAGLNAATDALAVEDRNSDAAVTYANIICVKQGNEDNELVKALVAALQSDEVKQYIEATYSGAVLPLFLNAVDINK